MAEHRFYVWATLMTEAAVDALVVGLVRRGFRVDPLASSKNLTERGELSTLCALLVYADHVPDPLPANTEAQNWTMDQVQEVLNASKCLWHSIITTHVGGRCTWRGSNIRLPKKAPTPEPQPPKEEPKREPTALDKIEETLG